MKFIKNILLLILIVVAVGFLFRNSLYQYVITYKLVGQRQDYVAHNEQLIAYLEEDNQESDNYSIQDIIELGLSKTSKQLNFTFDKNDKDPNQLVTSKNAHCVGYASFFATTCNYFLQKNKLSDDWMARARVGHLYLLGINIHSYSTHPFIRITTL